MILILPDNIFDSVSTLWWGDFDDWMVFFAVSYLYPSRLFVTPQIRDVIGQRQTYTYAAEALTY